MLARRPRIIPSTVRYVDGGYLEVVVDDLHHYYPGTELDPDYLETLLEGSGFDFRQIRQVLRDLDKEAAKLKPRKASKRD